MAVGSPTPASAGQDTSDTQGGIVHYRVKWTNTGGSSPTFPLSMSNGIQSVTYGATGILTIVTNNAWYQGWGVTGGIIQSTYNASTGACTFSITSMTAATGTVILVLRNEAGTAVAGQTGDIMFFDIEVQNSKSQ